MKNYIIMVAIAIILLGSLWYNFHQASKNKVLTENLEALNEQSEKLKKNNFRLIDSLDRISESFDEVLSKKSKENEVLASKKVTLQHKLKQDEEAINRIDNIDSIRTLFSEYYP